MTETPAGRSEIERDVDAELAFHLEMRIGELIREGVDAAEARRRAVAEFGDLEFTRAYCRRLDERSARQARSADRFAEWRQDLRFVGRSIRRSPAFAVVSLATLMLAIGANTAIFSVTRAVLLKPLPYGRAGSLVAVHEGSRQDPAVVDRLSAPNFLDYQAGQETLAGMAANADRTVTWRPRQGDPELLDALSVSVNTFDLLQVAPVIGRTFPSRPDPRNGNEVMLSHRFWDRAFGRDRSIVGRAIILNDLPYTVVGVMPPTFTVRGSEEVWTPLDLTRDMAAPDIARKQHYLEVLGRLEPGVSIAAARANLAVISSRLEREHPDGNTDRVARLVPLHTDIVGDLGTALLLLQAAAAVVLLIGCVNLANVTLSRAIGRRREFALRAALGASRSRLMRQSLTETTILALGGGALGVGVAAVATRVLLAQRPSTVPAFFHVDPDGSVLAFGLVLSVITGFAFGLLPARDAARAELQGTLLEGGRGATAGPRGDRVRRGLVVAQVALAVVLLVGAGLLVRSLVALTRAPLGYQPEGVLTAAVRTSGERYDSAGLANGFYDRVLDQIGRNAGVVAAGAASKVPVGMGVTTSLTIDGAANDPARLPDVGFTLVRGRYFEAMKIPLVAGRMFDPGDAADRPPVVIINDAAARAFFPAGTAVGSRVRLGPDRSDPWSTIVGVVGDVRDQGFDRPPFPTIYASHVQNSWWRSLTIVVRTTGDPRSAEGLVRRAVAEADPQLAIREVRTMVDRLGSSLAARRFALSLVSCFAVVALLLAAVGVYGVLAFSVTSRHREFGVRRALGATGPEVLMLVLKEGLGWSAIGLGVGVLAAAAAGRLVAGMLYGVGPLDGPTYLVVTISLLMVVTAACLVPALKATRVAPVTILQAD